MNVKWGYVDTNLNLITSEFIRLRILEFVKKIFMRRSCFRLAKCIVPSIIFIDEIEKITDIIMSRCIRGEVKEYKLLT